MQNSFDTSFIPQQPLLKVEGFEHRHKSINLALILSLVAFFVVLVVAAGVYFFHKRVEGEVRSLALELQEKEALLDIEEIGRLRDVDSRLSEAKSMLRDHTVFTTVFNFIEESTLENIGITALGYTDGQKGPTLMLAAQAPSYQAVFLQGETWKAMSPTVEKAEISSIILSDQTGVVNFAAQITLNRNLVRYAAYLNTEAGRADMLKAGVVPEVSVSPEEGATAAVGIEPVSPNTP